MHSTGTRIKQLSIKKQLTSFIERAALIPYQSPIYDDLGEWWESVGVRRFGRTMDNLGVVLPITWS